MSRIGQIESKQNESLSQKASIPEDVVMSHALPFIYSHSPADAKDAASLTPLLLLSNHQYSRVTGEWLRKNHSQLTGEHTLAQSIIVELGKPETEILEEQQVSEGSGDSKVAEPTEAPLTLAVINYLTHHFGPQRGYSLQLTYTQPPAELRPNFLYLYYDAASGEGEIRCDVLDTGNTRKTFPLPKEKLRDNNDKDLSQKITTLLQGGGGQLNFYEKYSIYEITATQGYPPKLFANAEAIRYVAGNFVQLYGELIYVPFEQKNILYAGAEVRNRFFDTPAEVVRNWKRLSELCVSDGEIYSYLLDKPPAERILSRTPSETAIPPVNSEPLTSTDIDRDVSSESTETVVSITLEERRRLLVENVRTDQFLRLSAYFEHFLNDFIAILWMRRSFVHSPELRPSGEVQSLFDADAQLYNCFLFVPYTRRAVVAYIFLRSYSDLRITNCENFHWVLNNFPDSLEIMISKEDLIFIFNIFNNVLFGERTEILKKIIKLLFVQQQFSAADYQALAQDNECAALLLQNDFVLQKLAESARRSRDLSHEPLLNILATLWYSRQDLETSPLTTTFNSDFIKRINAHMSGDMWYVLVSKHIGPLVEEVFRNSDIHSKLSARQLYNLMNQTRDPSLRLLLVSPGVITKFNHQLLPQEIDELGGFYERRGTGEPDPAIIAKIKNITPKSPRKVTFNLSANRYINPPPTSAAEGVDIQEEKDPEIVEERQAIPVATEESAKVDILADTEGAKDSEVAAVASEVGKSEEVAAKNPLPSQIEETRQAVNAIIEKLHSFSGDVGGSECSKIIEDLQGINQYSNDAREFDSRVKIVNKKLIVHQQVIDILLKYIVTAEQEKNKKVCNFLHSLLDELLAKKQPLGNYLTEDEFREAYESARDELEKQKKAEVNSVFQSRIQATLDAAEIVRDEHRSKRKPIPYCELMTTLKVTSSSLKAKDPISDGCKLQIYSEKLNGHPSLGWKILGGALMALGVIMMVGGVLLAIGTLKTGIGFFGGIGVAIGGSALLATGIGLFRHGRRKSISKEVYQLGRHIQKFPGISSG